MVNITGSLYIVFILTKSEVETQGLLNLCDGGPKPPSKLYCDMRAGYSLLFRKIILSSISISEGIAKIFTLLLEFIHKFHQGEGIAENIDIST